MMIQLFQIIKHWNMLQTMQQESQTKMLGNMTDFIGVQEMTQQVKDIQLV
jgi:hypothetical protein